MREQETGRPNPPPGVVRRPTLGIVGAGRVGSALARSLTGQGYTVGAVTSRKQASAQTLSEAVGSRVVAAPAEIAHYADLILLTVPDAAISSVCESLAQTDLTDKAVVHTSGATSVSTLLPARKRGALTGGFHPIIPVGNDCTLIPGATYGLEADREPLRGWLAGLVAALAGTPLWLRAGTDRARYHASAVLVSNYLVTLFSEALGLLSRYAVDEEAAHDALINLTQATVSNIAAQPAHTVSHTLTGPIARGDVDTIRAHLESIQKLDPDLAELYRQLGRRTLRLAAARGLAAEKLDMLQEILKHHANDDP